MQISNSERYCYDINKQNDCLAMLFTPLSFNEVRVLRQIMPRNCCTVCDGQPCKSNYDSTTEKITVYGFSKPLEEHVQVQSFPNILTCQILNNIDVSAKHWPMKVQLKGGYFRLVNLPSLFGSTSNSYLIKTLKTTPRNAENRFATVETWTLHYDRTRWGT